MTMVSELIIIVKNIYKNSYSNTFGRSATTEPSTPTGARTAVDAVLFVLQLLTTLLDVAARL